MQDEGQAVWPGEGAQKPWLTWEETGLRWRVFRRGNPLPLLREVSAYIP